MRELMKKVTHNKNHISIISVVLILLLLASSAAAASSAGRMGGTSFRSSSRTRSSSKYHSRTSSSSYHSTTNDTIEIGWPTIIIVLFVFCFCIIRYVIAITTSVVKLQVGLLGAATSLQKDLNQIAHKADTSTPKGFTYILKETTLSLLEQIDYCVSAYSSVEMKMGVEECEKLFNKLSIQERVKLDEETLVNFNNIRRQSATCRDHKVSDGVCNQYIVVTIIVAANGVHELQQIRNSGHLKMALKKLASIPLKDILAAEVLWTPQKEDDVFTQQQMLEDYPLLHSL